MADTVGEETADTGPATKKLRGKYTTQACVQCRQRKLNCSGENPCHTCVRRHRNCVFSDDRAVSDFLEQARKHLTADVLEGDVSIEARVGRLEAEMQMVAQELQTPRPDSSHYSETVDDVDLEITYTGETALHTPAHAFTENVQQIKERMGIPDGIDKSPRTVVSPQMTLHDETSITSQVQVQLGSRKLPFPDQQSYNDHLDFFFEDFNPCHPCVNEATFRSRSDRMLARREVQKNETCFLALHYVIFALADIWRDVSLLEKRALPLGRRWYKHADDLVGKIKYSGHGGLSLLQYLVFEALYLTHEDRPNAAYNIAGLMCRLCFQFGLHQQSRWPEDAHTHGGHLKERIFRTAYLTCMIAFGKFSGEVWDNMFSAARSWELNQQVHRAMVHTGCDICYAMATHGAGTCETRQAKKLHPRDPKPAKPCGKNTETVNGAEFLYRKHTAIFSEYPESRSGALVLCLYCLDWAIPQYNTEHPRPDIDLIIAPYCQPPSNTMKHRIMASTTITAFTVRDLR
ncbi:hypothetical protein LTR17_000270 [Elasticomyces elasticus]|nr:hypothetical protein LTR17_000270 [Elasticomyces elasticus]